jgi:transposase-like protein
MATATARPDAATLRRLYHGEQLTIAAIADALGVTASTVHNWLVAAGMSRRPSPATRRSDWASPETVEGR